MSDDLGQIGHDLADTSRTLAGEWERVREVWHDKSFRQFEREYWQEIASESQAIIESLADVTSIIRDAESHIFE